MFTGKYDALVAVVLFSCLADITYCLLKALRGYYSRRDGRVRSVTFGIHTSLFPISIDYIILYIKILGQSQ